MFKHVLLVFTLVLMGSMGSSAYAQSGQLTDPSAKIVLPSLEQNSSIKDSRDYRSRVEPVSNLMLDVETLAPIKASQGPRTVVNEANFIARPTPKPTPAQPVAQAPATTAAPVYQGVNRLWVPALGINSAYGFYGCANGSQDALPNGLFVWTCSGANNTYFVSHNFSTFYPVYQAFHNGTLYAGMEAYLADGAGNITKWRLAWFTSME